jgi:hypothetical protein
MNIQDTTFPLSQKGEKSESPNPRPVVPSVDKGDFYWADGEEIELSQRTDQISLSLTRPGLTLDSLLGAGKPLAGFNLEKTLAPNTYVLEKKNGSTVNILQVKEQLEGISGAKVAPVYNSPRTNSWLVTTNEIIVALKPDTDPQQVLGTDPRFANYRPLLGTPDQFVVTLKGDRNPLEIANSLQSDVRLNWATPNFYQQRERFFTPNDPLYTNQWHLHNTGQVGGTPDADVDAPEAWDVTPGGSPNVVIAVVDDGMQFNHPDLQVYVNPGEIANNGLDDDGNGWVDDVNGWDFTSGGIGDNNPGPSSPDDAHATSVAGVAAARGNNSLGVAGIAYQSKVLPVRIFDVFATDDANIASAIYYAAGREADGTGTWQAGSILNNSWGGGLPNTAITNAFTWASSNGRNGKGAISFIATGNDFADDVSYPAELSATIPGVIAVGASTNLNQRAFYSNYGPELDFVAPSGGPYYGGTANIVTTDRRGSDGYNTTPGPAGDYTTTGDDGFSGTSSATPLAAGIGTLILARNPNLTAAQVRGLMRNTTDLIGPSYNNNGFNQEYGYGKVNANAAVRGVGIAEIQVLDSKTNIPDNTGTVNFAAPIGGSQIKTFRVRNQGTSNLTLGAIAFPPGSGFTLVSGFTDTTLSVGESTTFTVRFAPTSLGNVSKAISFANSDADEAPFNFNLNGTGILKVNVGNNTSPIAIDVNGVPGNPYPSTINVTGQTGSILGVTVTLNGFSHTWPSDVDVLLVGPGGQKSLLMSDAGGSFDVSGVNLTFDPAATGPLPSILTGGTYLPTDFDDGLGGDTFNAPAPIGPYAADLSVFNGTDPNGTWSLYVMDDFLYEDSGSIAQGWSLNLLTTQPQTPGSISGTKWNDLDGDGVKEAGEPVLANWQVYIDGNQNGQLDVGEPTQITDAQGNYTFSNLQTGIYVIGEVRQPGWQQTSPKIGGFSADFSGAGGAPSLDGFTTDNTGGTVPGLWHLSTGRGNQPGHTADDSMYFGQGEAPNGGGNYDVGWTTGRITSPAINLTGLANPTLSFNYFLETEGKPAEYDQARVLISQNGGPFTAIASNAAELLDSTTGWTKATFDLGAYTGSSIRVRFNFDTIDTLYNNYEGWYVDDVAVGSAGLPGTHVVNLGIGENVTGKNFGNKQTPSPITLSITDATVIEGQNPNVVVTVNLSAASSQTVTVNYATANGTAIAGSDYTTATGTLLFAPGNTSQTITVPIIDNNISEVDETFTVNLSSPVNATISDSQGIVTVSDTLKSAVTATLPALIENLELTGTANINGTGNVNGNKLTGNSGNNTLTGLAGADTVNGGAGNDTYIFDTDGPLGSDLITDAAGIDTLNFANTTTKAISIQLWNPAAQVVTPGNLTLTLGSGAAIENAIGGSLNDVLTGNILANSLSGGAGNDILNGGAGADTLNGGAGADNLNGGAGKDILTGAGGNTVQDTFTYNALNESLLAGFDVIKDYDATSAVVASRDRINAPATIPVVNLTVSKGTAANISPAAIQAVLTAAAFGANTAAALKVTGFTGTFVAFNDGVAGFQAATDSILQLENYNIGSANPVVII